MGCKSWQRAVAVWVLATLISITNAQPPDDEFFSYLPTPTLLWSEFATSSTNGVQQGNGLYMSPDGQMLVATSFDGTVRAFEPQTGAILWTYQPDSIGLQYRCFSGVTFNYQADPKYLVYAIADGAQSREDTSLAET